MGIGNYTEADVYAAARVFTGWNWQLRRRSRQRRRRSYYQFVYNAGAARPDGEGFTFAIYPDGGKTIPARAAAQGMQDGLDLDRGAGAASRRRRTRLATRLYKFFVNDVRRSGPALISEMANTYLSSDYNIKAMLRRLFSSEPFLDRRELRSGAIRGRPSSSSGRSRKPAGPGFSVDTAH